MMRLLILGYLFFISTLVFSQKEQAFVIYRANGKKASYKQMKALALENQLVFFGEFHDNPISHWLEYELMVDLYAENQSSLVLTNENISNTVQTSLTQANFKNCIFYGSSNYGIALEKTGAIFNYKFDNCLIKFVDNNNQIATNPLYQFSTNTAKYVGCIFATNLTANKPEFKNTSINDFRINENSICRNNANFAYSFPLDILGTTRTNPSDIGAYEYLP